MERQFANKEQVINNIKSCRAKKGLTQKETADLLNLSRYGYIKWETNPLSLSMDKLYRLADVLECNVEDFLLV